MLFRCGHAVRFGAGSTWRRSNSLKTFFQKKVRRAPTGFFRHRAQREFVGATMSLRYGSINAIYMLRSKCTRIRGFFALDPRYLLLNDFPAAKPASMRMSRDHLSCTIPLTLREVHATLAIARNFESASTR